mmetsp:Transcript_31187/g.52637  ORF Transcript_31187/g.52637 Transcript_31187/m.52637 type:complete len:219 (+) Transcript_31187:290-946(+)
MSGFQCRCSCPTTTSTSTASARHTRRSWRHQVSSSCVVGVVITGCSRIRRDFFHMDANEHHQFVQICLRPQITRLLNGLFLHLHTTRLFAEVVEFFREHHRFAHHFAQVSLVRHRFRFHGSSQGIQRPLHLFPVSVVHLLRVFHVRSAPTRPAGHHTGRDVLLDVYAVHLDHTGLEGRLVIAQRPQFLQVSFEPLHKPFTHSATFFLVQELSFHTIQL